jgi:hypothetical protein
VTFFLHPTFRPSTQTVKAQGGAAVLRLHGRGAFTVGALANGSGTTLELDLALDETLPAPFRSR